MNLCLNAFVIQFPDDLLDTYLVTASRVLVLRYAHRGHCKDYEGYKEWWSHVEFSISLTRIRLQRAIYFCLHRDSLPENTAGGQPRFGAKPAPKNFCKILYVIKNH